MPNKFEQNKSKARYRKFVHNTLCFDNCFKIFIKILFKFHELVVFTEQTGKTVHHFFCAFDEDFQETERRERDIGEYERPKRSELSCFFHLTRLRAFVTKI